MNSKPKTTTLLRSPAKLNLFLHVINKRSSGYHSIESLFVPIMWFDEIYIEKTDDGVITREGDLAGDLAGDLLVKSAKLLKKYAYQYLGNHNEIISSSGCRIFVKKNIPSGAGLGGGSSNAALTLKTLNVMWNLNFTSLQLSEIGKEIGADVPFFLQDHSCFVSGIGEKLSQIMDESFLPHYFVILIPKIEVSTLEIFNSLNSDNYSTASNFLFLESNQTPSFFKEFNSGIWTYGRNDLESTTCNNFPIVGIALNLLKKLAKIYDLPENSCRMSGTGGAIFCSAPTLAIARKIKLQIEKNSKDEFISKVCRRLVCKKLTLGT